MYIGICGAQSIVPFYLSDVRLQLLNNGRPARYFGSNSTERMTRLAFNTQRLLQVAELFATDACIQRICTEYRLQTRSSLFSSHAIDLRQ